MFANKTGLKLTKIKTKLRDRCFLLILLCTFLTLTVAAEGSSPAQPYTLEAGDIIYDSQQGRVIAEGEVSFKSGDLVVKSDRLWLDLNTNIVRAGGERVILKTADQEVMGTYLKYNYVEAIGTIYGARSKIGELNFRGGSIRLLQGEDYDLEIEEASFTPCILPDPHYQVKADQVQVYPDGKVVGKRVEFWFGDFRLLSLPSYVVKYDDSEGDRKLRNPVPLPHLGYNSKDGFTVKYYYPYQVNENWQGEIFAEVNQEGEQWAGVDTSYQLSPLLKLRGNYKYSKELEDDEETFTREEIFSTGLNYNFSMVDLFTGVDYDFIDRETILKTNLQYKQDKYSFFTGLSYNLTDKEREEKFKIDYYPFKDYRLNFYHGYINEELKENSYSIGYQGGPVSWTLQQREGYEIDYLPYLTLNGPSYQLRGIRLKGRAGLGRVRNEGVTADKVNLDLHLSKAIKLTPNLNLSLQGRITDNLYFRPSKESYLVFNSAITGTYSSKLSPAMNLKTTLGYEITEERGKALLPDDKEDVGKFLKTGLDLTYLLLEPESAWVFGINGKYKIETGEWDQAFLSLTRKYDCFSLSVNYDLADNSFGFSFDI